MNAMSILLNVRYWILAAIVIGFIVGDIGGENDALLIIIFLMIMMCFSLTKMKFVKDDLAHYRKHVLLAILLCSFVATLITLGVGLFYPKEMWNGWVILACVPCAISVVSGTMFMKGDSKMIMISLSVIYILAIVLTPLFSYLIMGNAIDPMEIVKYILLFVVIPILVSLPLRKANIPDNINTIIINFTFSMFALIAIGRSRDFFFDDFGLALSVIAASAVRIALAHLVFEYTMRHFGMSRGDRIPFSLLLIWRNSGLALAMVLLLFPDNNMALAPASISMIFEQFYLMFMMWYYERIVPAETAEVDI